MAGETQTIPLNELSVRITKGTTPTTLGLPFVEKGINFVKSEAISASGTIDPTTFAFIDEDTHAELSRSQLQEGDILFSMAGVYLGKTAVVKKSILPANTNQAVGIIRLDLAKADPHFIHYALSSPECRSWVHRSVAQSAQPNFNLRDIGNLPIPALALAEQRAIAHILGTLDDKIELNRRMSETLEAMARALFKSWFVDFDPVRAKREGRWQRGQSLPGLPAHLYDLFPDRLVDSALGKIPEWWEVTSIYAVADVIYGAPFASVQFNTDGVGAPLIRIRDLARENPGVWTPEVHQKGYKVRPGDIVVGMDGEFRAYLWGGPDAWLNQRLCVFAPKSGCSAAFVRNSIIEPLAEIEATETATTVIHLGKSDIDRFMIVVPTKAALNAFSQVCQPWYDRIVATKREATILTGLRDTLLPKLISGELRVPDAERLVEAAQ